MKQSLRIVFVLMVILLVVAACDSAPTTQKARGFRHPFYEWVFLMANFNPKSYGLTDVNLTYNQGGVKDNPDIGILPWGAGASYGPGLDPIPEKITIHWKEMQDRKDRKEPPFVIPSEEHTQDIEVAKHIPDMKNWAGEIWLVYYNGKWKVVPWGKDQVQKLIDERKFDQLARPPLDKSMFEEPATRPTTTPTTKPN